MTILTIIPTPGKLYTVNFPFRTDSYFKNKRMPCVFLDKNDILLSLESNMGKYDK